MQVFMTRTDILNCVHEPFGDAFYYGPERLSSRYEEDVQGRQASGFSDSTYKSIFEKLEKEAEKVRFGFSRSQASLHALYFPQPKVSFK